MRREILVALLLSAAVVSAGNFKCCVYQFVDPEQHVGENVDARCPQLCVSRYSQCPLPIAYTGVCIVDPSYERPSSTCRELGCHVQHQTMAATGAPPDAAEKMAAAAFAEPLGSH